MKLGREIASIAVIASAFLMTACGGGSSNSSPTISVALTPHSGQAIDEGQTVQFAATLTNDNSGAGVSWSQSGLGSLSNQTTTTATYTAPLTGAPGTATVTAASVTDPSKTASAQITVTAPPSISNAPFANATIGASYNQAIGVTGGAGALNFSIDSGSLPTGLGLNSATGAITGTPTGATGATSFSVKVVDSSTAGAMSATQEFSIAVNPAATVSITTSSLLNPLVGELYNQSLEYSLGSATLPLTWSLASGTLPTGLALDPVTGKITGTATATGTTNFTVALTDSSPTPVTATKVLSLTVTSAADCGSGSESVLHGQYALSLNGFDPSGPVGILASFTADGTGKLSAGVLDINSNQPSGVQTNLTITTASSSYSLGSDNKGCLTLVAGGVTRNFRFTVSNISNGISSEARVVEFDFTGTNTVGNLTLQDPKGFSNSAVVGSFNYTMSSALPAAAGGGYAAAVGVLTLAGTSVSGVGDVNINGTMNFGNTGYPATPITFTPGVYNIATNGRGTLSFTPPGQSTIHLVAYVLNAGELITMSQDAQSAATPLFVGFLGAQSGAPYDNTALNGTSVMFMSGQTAPGTSNASRVEAGIVSADGSGGFSFATDLNSGGSISSQTESGTYVVEPDGRVLVTDAGAATPHIVMYIVGRNQGLVMSADNHVMVGDIEPQTGAPFTNASLSGTHAIATISPIVPANLLYEGAETYDGAGNLDLTFELNDNGWLSLENAMTASYTVSSNGRVISTWDGTSQKLGYIISPTRLVTFGNTGDANPTLTISQQ